MTILTLNGGPVSMVVPLGPGIDLDAVRLEFAVSVRDREQSVSRRLQLKEWLDFWVTSATSVRRWCRAAKSAFFSLSTRKQTPPYVVI